MQTDYSVTVAVLDRFRLDGGAMFGSVPKVLWQKAIAADAENRIPLACRVLILEAGDRRILVDCGLGRHWSERERNMYAIEHCSSPFSSFGEVTDVILTHLHFDHAGGIATSDGEGRLSLTFPKAVVHLQRANWERAHNPGQRERASYLRSTVEPLEGADLRFAEDGDEILPAITVHRADGHTMGLQWILIRNGDRTFAYPSDLIPTSHHLPVPYVMGYDLHAEKSIAEKEAFLEQAAREEWVVVFEHDPEIAAGIVGRDDRGRYHLSRPVELSEFRKV